MNLTYTAEEKEENKRTILDYLENSYTGAKAADDPEMMVRIARAIAAFNLDPETDCVIEPVSLQTGDSHVEFQQY